MKRWCIGTGVLAATLALALPAMAADYARPELLISTEELAGIVSSPDVKILDGRKPEEYGAGHIPNALSLPSGKTQYTERGVPGLLAPVDRLEALLGELGIRPSDTVVLYDDIVGEPAARLFWTFDVLGHARIRVLNGGMSTWVKEGRALSTEAVIVYCRTGMRSSHAYLALKLLGYPRVRNYDASMIEWGNRPELPVEK